jgi:PqqD family protein of HPr-rel-A system
LVSASQPAPGDDKFGVYRSNAADLLWAEWEDLSAVFHRPSGETHILDALSAELLSILTQTPCDAAEAGRRLAERCGDGDGGRWTERAAVILNSLRQLGLIREDVAAGGRRP